MCAAFTKLTTESPADSTVACQGLPRYARNDVEN
jgi:hypothetical protein